MEFQCDGRGEIIVEDAAARDDDAQPGEPTRRSSKGEVLGYAIALGPVFGAAFGLLVGQILFDNIGIGLSIGAGLGLVIGAVIGSWMAGRQDREGGPDER